MKKLLSIIGVAAMLATGGNARAQTFQDDLNNLWKDTLGSSNMVYAGFAERKLTGNADSAGLIGAFNFNNNFAIIGGINHQWARGQAGSTYNISGGIQLQLRVYPLHAFGFTNFYIVPFGVTAVGTPVNGDNGGNLMNANRAGANIPIYTWTINKNPLEVSAGGFYGNQTGTGKYDGNWAGVDIAVRWGDGGASMAAIDLRTKYAMRQQDRDF
jgi:hypothetical protein